MRKSGPILVTGLFLLAAWGAPAWAGQVRDWILRNTDFIKLDDGQVLEVQILENRDGVVKYKEIKTGVRSEVPLSSVKQLIPRAGPVELFERYILAAGSNMDEVAAVAKQALEHFPDHRQLRVKVLACLEKSAAQPTVTPDLLEVLAGLYLTVGNPETAESTARRLVQARPSATSLDLLGLALAAQGKVKDAVDVLEKALKAAPDREDIQVALAEAYLQEAHPEKASEVFSKTLEKNPRSVSALAGLGLVHLRQGNLEEAFNTYLRASEIDKRSVKAFLGQAACKVLTADWDVAYRTAGEARDIDPRNAQAFALQALANFFRGDNERLSDVERKISDALEYAPAEPRILAFKAAYYARAALVDAAAGKADDAADKTKQADKAWDDLAKANPPDAWVQYLVAERALNRGDAESAAAGFKRASELEDGYAPAHQAVGAVALRQVHYKEAEAAYQRALERTDVKDPRRADYYAGLGLALLGMKNRNEEALAALRKAREYQPNNVSALLGLGYMANYERKEETARGLFQQALGIDGRCLYAAEALQKIYAQRFRRLEYYNFDTPLPKEWAIRGGGVHKANVKDGRLEWKGTQGAAAGAMGEVALTVHSDEFQRLEADLEVSPTSPVIGGLRLVSGPGATVFFYIEFGKDDAKNIAYRLRDYSGQATDWMAIEPWPASGKVRLALETLEPTDLAEGQVHLFVNGVDKGRPKNLQFLKAGKINVGFFCLAPQKEAVDFGVDNVVLVLRQIGTEQKEAGHGELIKDDTKKPERPGN